MTTSQRERADRRRAITDANRERFGLADLLTPRRLAVARHRATSAQVSCLYPATVQGALPAVGPLLGVDHTAGGAGLWWDPFETYAHGLVTNPNVFVLGEPGFAKSSLVKCYCYWQHAIYGPVRWLTICDPKGEYVPLARLIGMSIVHLAPGGSWCINPLHDLTIGRHDASSSELDAHATLVYGLTATQLNRALTPLERKLLRDTVTQLATGRVRQPTLVDLLAVLADPPAALAAATARTVDEVRRDGEQVRFALDELHCGPLRGMFDGPTNVTVDWDGPGLVIDFSAVLRDKRALALVMVAALAWSRAQHQHARGRQRVNINDESYYLYANAATVEFAQERRKLGRAYGEANIDICHRPSDLGAQADDGTATAKIAQGLLADTATTITFRQHPGELDLASRLLGLTNIEAHHCVARFPRANALWKIGDLSILASHYRPDCLREVTDTDHLMRRAPTASTGDG